jgi:hypothetical protein
VEGGFDTSNPKGDGLKTRLLDAGKYLSLMQLDRELAGDSEDRLVVLQ